MNFLQKIATRLKPEFAHNPENFPHCYCQKVDHGLNSLMYQLNCSGVRYLSYESVKYNFDITLLEWKALLPLFLPLLHEFQEYHNDHFRQDNFFCN